MSDGIRITVGRPVAPGNPELKRIANDAAAAVRRSLVATLHQQGQPPGGSAEAAFAGWLDDLPIPQFQRLRQAAEAMEQASQASFGRFDAVPGAKAASKGSAGLLAEASPLALDLARFSVTRPGTSSWTPNRELRSTRSFVDSLGAVSDDQHEAEFKHEAQVAIPVGSGPSASRAST